MQHGRKKENAFVLPPVEENDSHSPCLRGRQQKRCYTTRQRARESAILLFTIGVCLTSFLTAAAADEDEDEERIGESSLRNANLQDAVWEKNNRTPASQYRHEEQSDEMKKKEHHEPKKEEKTRKKANKEAHKRNKGGKGDRDEGESPPTRCAQNLRDAVNGAISLIAGTRLLVEHLLRLWGSVPYVPMLVCPSSLFPYNPTLPWPKREKLKKGDLLRDVLDTGVLTVAGVGGASLSSGQVQLTVAKDRGDEGNYNRAEPTGFFPDYLRAIADTIEKQYNAPIRVRWLFYPSVESAQAGVLRGEAHMTDIYFLLAHSTPGEPQPLAHFYSTCPVVGSPVLLIVRETPSLGGGIEISDLLSLNRVIDHAKTDADRHVVFVSSELATTVRHCLSPFSLTGFAEDLSQAAQLVLDGHALAVVTTGVLPRLHPLLRVVTAHILLGKGAWIERTYAVECVEDEHGIGLAAYAKERSPGESKRVFGGSGDADENSATGGMQRNTTWYAAWLFLLSIYVIF